MFIDQATITVAAGNGGNGAVSFHREKYVNRGGPDGGDGGRGGNVYFEATRNAHTLENFRHRRTYAAERGADGGKNNMFGKGGDDLVIKVPAGTLVRDAETKEVLLDMFADGEKKILVRGGRGGRGNAKFATPTRQTPRFAIPGQEAQSIEVILELRTIADVGLVGMPNVGKSTLLAVLTAARPKIANYHFTTLAPNLGVVEVDSSSFVLADIPGLIEGAAEGAGLGHDFLRHIKRTRTLLHILDGSGIEGRDPYEDFVKINAELASYSEELTKLPQIVVANKMDLMESRENFNELKAKIEKTGAVVFPISAATQEGIQPMLRAVVALLKDLPVAEPYDELGEIEQDDTSKFEIVRGDDASYIVDGPFATFLMRRTNIDDVDSLRHFQHNLKRFGVVDALNEAGAVDGDVVVVDGFEFEFTD